MLSWKDLQYKTVGREEIDIDRLKEITQYKECGENDDVVKRLWRVLAGFKNEDKARYLQFVWGRTRLPLKEETDIEQHTVEVDHKKPVGALPIGKTCFF